MSMLRLFGEFGGILRNSDGGFCKLFDFRVASESSLGEMKTRLCEQPEPAAANPTMTKTLWSANNNNEDVNPFRKKKSAAMTTKKNCDEARKGVWSASAVNFYSTSLYFSVLFGFPVRPLHHSHLCMHACALHSSIKLEQRIIERLTCARSHLFFSLQQSAWLSVEFG
jgi:hypothetical protein